MGAASKATASIVYGSGTVFGQNEEKPPKRVTMSEGKNCLVVNLEMNLKTFAGIIFLTLFSVAENCYGLTAIIKDLLRNNVAGPAVNFQTVSWPIDPDAGLRRRTEYEALNGKYGYKHVERLGLGEDGRTEERRRQQRLRDEIGALAYTPSLQTGY